VFHHHGGQQFSHCEISISKKRAEPRFVYFNGMGMLCECAMERTELVKRLAQLDLQVWDVTQQVTNQRGVIAQLNAVGMDTNEPQLLLSRLENLLIHYLQTREKLREELTKLDGGSTQEPKLPDR
jgi:hypothetical protein